MRANWLWKSEALAVAQGWKIDVEDEFGAIGLDVEGVVPPASNTSQVSVMGFVCCYQDPGEK